jgi:hypothetical protein
MTEQTAEIIPTRILPPDDLDKLGIAVREVEDLSAQLPPLREKAKSIPVKWPDREHYLAIGAVLTEVRNLRKQGEAKFAPFDLIVQRVKDWLRTKKQAHTNACEEIEAICKPKMKLFEQAEAEAAAKEQKQINEKRERRGEEVVTVKPSIPSVGGYRRSTVYKVEVIDADKLLKMWANTKSLKHRAFLRKFITLSHTALADEAREMKDPEKFMHLIPGVRCWKD